MAKICPQTGEYVLYVDCLECEDRGRCGDLKEYLSAETAETIEAEKKKEQKYDTGKF